MADEANTTKPAQNNAIKLLIKVCMRFTKILALSHYFLF